MKILKIIWQLPQTIIGFFVWLWVRKWIMSVSDFKGATVYLMRKKAPFFGVCFGTRFIFIQEYNASWDKIARAHEYGHSVQSLILGPLYLLVVGAISGIRCWISSWDPNMYKAYYKHFPENWADKLGGVKR